MKVAPAAHSSGDIDRRLRTRPDATSWTETNSILVESAEKGSIGYHFGIISRKCLGHQRLFWSRQSKLRPRIIRGEGTGKTLC